MTTCARCGWCSPYHARGMCKPCYAHERDRKALIDYPRVYRRREDVIQDVAELAQAGMSRDRVVSVLGITWDAIALAHRRAGVAVPAVYFGRHS